MNDLLSDEQVFELYQRWTIASGFAGDDAVLKLAYDIVPVLLDHACDANDLILSLETRLSDLDVGE